MARMRLHSSNTDARPLSGSCTSKSAAIKAVTSDNMRFQSQGIEGIEGIPPGIFEVMPPAALLATHDAKMSVACCATYPCSMLVALGSGSFVLPANVEAAAEITDGLLKSDGDAVAGLETWLPSALQSALFAADC
jgi:hypothetical protein